MNMPTVIMLAAGRGSRFWPITKPKEQLVIFGKPLIVHNLEALARAGFERVIIVGTPDRQTFITSLKITGLDIKFAALPASTGMADAVLSAQKALKDEAVFIMNAEDVVEDGLYTQMMDAVKKEKSFVVGRTVKEYFDGGYLITDGSYVTGIVEKPGEGKAPSDVVNLVYHYFSNAADFLQKLKETKSTADDVYEKALLLYMKDHKVSLIRYDGAWSPLKYPWHVLSIMEILFTKLESHKGQNVQIKNNVVIEGNVWIGDNVKIFENTKITGPCYIGNNSIIGNNSMIRESHLGDGCITGFSTDITRSYIGDNCWFHSNYVGDSVLEGSISMGSGAVLANLRLDEGPVSSMIKNNRFDTKRLKLGAVISRDVRVGVNSSIMPGVKVGSNSFVGSGIILDSDVPDDSFCVGETRSYMVKKNTKSINPNARNAFKKSL